MILFDYSVFEECVAKLFEISGYEVTRNVRTDGGLCEADIVAKREGKEYFVEIKLTQATENAVMQIYSSSMNCDVVPVLVTSYVIDEAKRKKYGEKCPGIVLIDIANLLYAAQSDTRLYNRLISVLPFAIDDIEPKAGFLQSETLEHHEYTESLIGEMRLCTAGKTMATRYEEVCRLMLENIFSEDLALWKTQQRSNNDLYKFDLLCRIKDRNKKTFWSILERFFNSKYIVFEFKNYSEKVTQKEIYTTEKYLYARALRSVAILIAANGYEDNARWAAKGCLRENGKLIVLLTTEDLIRMNEMKIKQDDPTDYLMSKLDDLLLELEK